MQAAFTLHGLHFVCYSFGCSLSSDGASIGFVQEDDKARLVQETGLQLKQINNWFINQRKRNWHSNPSSSTAVKSKRKRYISANWHKLPYQLAPLSTKALTRDNAGESKFQTLPVDDCCWSKGDLKESDSEVKPRSLMHRRSREA